MLACSVGSRGSSHSIQAVVYSRQGRLHTVGAGGRRQAADAEGEVYTSRLRGVVWGGGYFCMGSPPGPTPLRALWRMQPPLPRVYHCLNAVG